MDVMLRIYTFVTYSAKIWRGVVLLLVIFSVNVYATDYIYQGPLTGYTDYTLGGSLIGGDTLTVKDDMLRTNARIVGGITSAGNITIQPYVVGSTYTLQSTLNSVDAFVEIVRIRNNGTYIIQSGVNIQGTIVDVRSLKGVDLNLSVNNNTQLNCDITLENQFNTAPPFVAGIYTILNPGGTERYLTNNGNVTITSSNDNVTAHGVLVNSESDGSHTIVNNGNIDVTSTRNIGTGISVFSYGNIAMSVSNNGTIKAGLYGAFLYNDPTAMNPLIFNNTGTITVTGNDLNAAAIYGETGTVPFTVNLNGGTINGKIKNVDTINFGNNATTVVNGDLVSINSVIVNAGATATINGNSTINTSFTNSGNAVINGNSTINTSFTNSGSAVINGDITINTFFTNSGSAVINGNTTINTFFTNSGIVVINGNSMINNAFASSGTVDINGNRTITATDYINSGAQNFTITSASVYDGLTCSCPANLTGATVNIASSIAATYGNTYSWQLLSATSLSPPNADDFVFPYTFLGKWTPIINSTSIGVQLEPDYYSGYAIGGFNQEVAQVLDQMSDNITNSSQQQLIKIFDSIDNPAQFNNALHQMMPISNVILSNAQMQSIIMYKVGTRIAAVQDSEYLPHGGINTGDMLVSSGMWLTSSGSVTNQYASGTDDGYNANTAVVLLGMDVGDYANLLGFGGGYSFSKVKEKSNANFVNDISRYHGVLYGSHNNYNVFTNWLMLGSYDNNRAHRNILINGNNLNTHADFNSWQLAAKLERGIGFDFFDNGRISPSAYLQYAFLHQSPYSEAGSIAALNVEQVNKNIATVGAMARLNFPFCSCNAIGSIELRVGASYDVINNLNTTTANFIIGSEFFTVVSSPARIAAQAGGGVTLEFSKHLQMSLDYNFDYRSNFYNNTGLLKLKYLF